jgi:hypothetical protein
MVMNLPGSNEREQIMNESDVNKSKAGSELDRKINSRAGGALLIVIGLSIWLDIGWGWSAVLVGIILLTEQAARWRLDLKFQRFWVIAGLIALGTGVSVSIGLQEALVPLLLVLAGGVLIAKTFMDRP